MNEYAPPSPPLPSPSSSCPLLPNYSEKEMRDFAAGKGFVRLPFEPTSGRDNAATSFGVQALPTLVVVNGDTGAVVTTWGRSAISKNPKGCLAEWKAGRSGVTWLQLLKPW